jgi:hypothetical protein
LVKWGRLGRLKNNAKDGHAERILMQTNKKSGIHNLETEIPSDLETRFQSGIYLFRDYWSNLKRFGRNKQNEGLGWEEDSEEFSSGLLTETELIAEKDGKGYVRLKDANGQELFEGFVDPYQLIREFEPLNIVVENIFGDSLYQLPHSLIYAGVKDLQLGRRVFGKMENPTPERVYTQKLAHLKEIINKTHQGSIKNGRNCNINDSGSCDFTWLLTQLFAFFGTILFASNYHPFCLLFVLDRH